MLNLLLLFGIFISGVNCGYYFVTVPNVIRYNHDETVIVSVFELHNAAVKVWLQFGEKQFSTQNIVVPNEDNPETVTVKVTEADLLAEDLEEKPRHLLVCSEYIGQQQCREVILSYQTGYLIVQTDKPIYTPQQKVKVRTLALDESLKAVDGWQVGMEIVSPTNLTLARRKIAKSASGFFENIFTLPPYPDTGIWTARAFYYGQFETESQALFEVQEYVLPTFAVDIYVDAPFILQDTLEILVTVKAKYVYGKPVDGNARLTLNLKDEIGVSEYIADITQLELQGGWMDAEGSAAEFLINITTIMLSPLLREREFPKGSRLEIVATVFEYATGKEEAASHDGTIFAIDPYIFKFSRSKLNFRPGYEYYLKVDLFYANGQPVVEKEIRVDMLNNKQHVARDEVVTNSKGQATLTFLTSNGADTFSFIAATLDERQESEPFEVLAYVGKNQIHAEQLIKDNEMIFRASSNIQGSGSTGMLFMAVSRGKVMFKKFKKAANQASEPVTEQLQELISPSARLLVFYVDKGTNELVADSVKFDVDQKCRDKGLNLKTKPTTVEPGSNQQLNITGDPMMWVGLNVMDKKLLLLNDENVLKKSKMFEAFESHDTGCGEGSGRNSADVFKKAGLTLLTNAVVSENDLQRRSLECEGQKMRKRSADDECYYQANVQCCEQGYKYAEKLFEESAEPERIDPKTKCYAEARNLVIGWKLPLKCVMAHLLSCKVALMYLISERTFIVSKSFGVESEYASDLERLASEGVKPRPRTDFRESWLFEINQLDKSGKLKKILSFPDSITEWRIQAIGITADKGMCIADSLDVTAYRDFFIELDLPYKATRLEYFDVKATIFNYGLPMDEPKTANIYLEGVEHLCYNKRAGGPSPKIQIELPPNSAQTLRFPMVPLRQGKFPIKVSALVINKGIPQADAIEKKLYVVAEGVQEQITIQICLDPGKQMEDCENDARVIGDDAFNNNEESGRQYTVDLTLPKQSLPGTGEATGYMQTTIMDNVVKTLLEDVDSLFQQPAGCGEQTMIRLAPTVYAMKYLKDTGQITDDIEVKGNQWIRDGVTREVSQYRHPRGSYSAWQSRPASTWLTAFVGKVLCQAHQVVDDAVDKEKDIAITIDWLKNQVTEKGDYVDLMPVIHREMIGQINERDPSLTAFVLITLMECNIRTEDMDQKVRKSMEFLESLDRNLLTNNPYLLAITTYALALAKSHQRWEFKNLLDGIANRVGKELFWGNPGGKPANAHSVETTAYALLAMMEFNDFKSSGHIVRWLTSQRDAKGSFRTTQDTVVGLQALSTYTIRTFSKDVDLKVELFASEWKKVEFRVTREHAFVQQMVKNLPVEHQDNLLKVKVTGTGAGRMMIDLRYNRKATEEERCPFVISDIETQQLDDLEIDVNLAAELNCDICNRCEHEPEIPDDYDLEILNNPVEVDPKIRSNFGKRKKRANRGIRATSPKTCIRFSVRSASEKNFGMSIVNFGLQTGVEVVKSDLDELVKGNTTNIARYEMPSSGQGYIVFYLEQITSEETHFIFRLKDSFDVNDKDKRQPSSVKIYDYYNPERSCTKLYGTDGNQHIGYECDKNQEVCQCFQSRCGQRIDERIKSLAKQKKPVALHLHRHTCNPKTANYAVEVQIDQVDYDPETDQVTARGLVKRSLHKGIQQLDEGDEMTFFCSMNCFTQLGLEEGHEYYIIGRDGNTFETDEGQQFRYPLTGTALVAEKPVHFKGRRLARQSISYRVFFRYIALITGKGCQA